MREGGDEQDEHQVQTCEQFMLGPHILVQPITTIKELTEPRVYLPSSVPTAPATWYDLNTAVAYHEHRRLSSRDGAVVADHVPAFVRGGAILPKRERQRRSSQGTHTDPFTLVVAPDAVSDEASGSLPRQLRWLR